MTGIRLNMSHTSLHESAEWLENYQEAQRLAGIKADLLIDLQGPELRIEAPEEELQLTDGGTVLLLKKSSEAQGRKEIYIDSRILDAISTGDRILLNDGAVELEAQGVQETKDVPGGFSCLVIRGGKLSGRKSIKIIGKSVEMPVLTCQDLENIDCARQYGVTALMQPFVTSGDQLRQIRNLLKEKGLAGPETGLRLFAKIENREGAGALSGIMQQADVTVIARGDLGNDVPLWELPALQKRIAASCRECGKPFLVVTQMLTSMITNPVPTRAEVSDIFNAVLDGASAVMVTNETAVGRYPAEVIRYMKYTCDTASRYMMNR